MKIFYVSDLGNSIDIRLDTFTENSNRCACVSVFYSTSKCTPDTYAHTFVYTYVEIEAQHVAKHNGEGWCKLSYIFSSWEV